MQTPNEETQPVRQDAIVSVLAASDCSLIEGVICTDYAIWARDVLGRGMIFGFFNHTNPGTKTGQHSGGHDFLVVDERFIVDLWLREVVQWTDQVVFDLQSEADREAIREFYGDQSGWSVVPR